MTRTNVTEGELVDIGRAAIALFGGLQDLADAMDERGRGSQQDRDRLDNLAEIARELSDEVDALCEYIRHSRMLD